MPPMPLHWDIFCRVVDNYGDIGVCWRLARQLAGEHGLAVRLWVDDPASLAPLCPACDPSLPAQQVQDVEIRRWTADFVVDRIADVVIEAFACELPTDYIAQMATRPAPPRWINLEYLSAEAWIEGCHGLASPHPDLPLVKYFFFPGFTPTSGGLLREAGLSVALPLAESETLEISLFCYDTAPVGDLLAALAASPRPVLCHVPPGKPLAAVEAFLAQFCKTPLSIEPPPLCGFAASRYAGPAFGCPAAFGLVPNFSPARGEGLETRADTPLPPRGGGAGGEGEAEKRDSLNSPETHWLAQRAIELREQQTPHEHALWQQLRAKRFSGYKFRRQQPLAGYIVDFVCFSQRLIVELDGGQHAEATEYDVRRDAGLKRAGFRVLRFWNTEWATQQDAVLETIWRALQETLFPQPPPLPNPARGDGLETASSWRFGNLRIQPLPFLPLDDYDALLRHCAVNFVRGEDSFVRAQWAGRPFVWHIYPQDDNAHHAKLDAFLERYCAGMNPVTASVVRDLFAAWNDGGDVAAIWPAFCDHLPEIARHNAKWARQLAGQLDLATRLVNFVADKV